MTGGDGRPTAGVDAGQHVGQLQRRAGNAGRSGRGAGGRRRRRQNAREIGAETGHLRRRLLPVHAEHFRRHPLHPSDLGHRHGRRHPVLFHHLHVLQLRQWFSLYIYIKK